MVSKDLINYIKECRKKGFSDFDIRNALIEKGWNEKDILEAILTRPTKHLPKWVSLLGLIFIILSAGAIIWTVFFMLNDIKNISQEVTAITQNNGSTKFCGTSTNGQCSSDTDCITGGCSGQICQSKNEEPVVTTCEYKDCYDTIGHGVRCKCINKKCQWQ